MMDETFDPTAWSALLLGLYTLFAGIGALRKPDVWRQMLTEIEKLASLQLLAGLLEMMLGAAFYLANPWIPADVLTCVLKSIGGVLMIEALVIIGFSDIYSGFWLRNLSHMHRGWALFSVLIGLALTVVGFMRFH